MSGDAEHATVFMCVCGRTHAFHDPQPLVHLHDCPGCARAWRFLFRGGAIVYAAAWSPDRRRLTSYTNIPG